jgi:DNA polymerase-3 subunit gamma/tau
VAYLSLYRKHRPETFADILGQEHVSQTLAKSIVEDRVAHAYLFTGPRGTGKTSTARILAKAINCERGPTPSPCGRCNSCVSITDGSSLDVIELDAASHSGVDDTRDILAGVALATAGSRKKVYVIDEVHMLTTQSFNALLKTLEEPPPHVIFILATTEAHKVLPTIQSRTQRFDFRPASTDLIHQLLESVAKSEGIEIENEAVDVIARHAEGSFRDGLAVLDQLSSFDGEVTVSDVDRLLGARSEDVYIEMFDALATGDLGAVFKAVHSLVSQGADVRQLAAGALRHARSLLLLLTAPDADHLLEVPDEERPVLAVQAARFTPAALLRAVDLIAKALTDMREMPNHRLLFEVALVRAAAPATDPSARGLLGRIERIERRMGIDQGAAEMGIDQGAAEMPAAETPKTTPEADTPAAEGPADQIPTPDTPSAESPAAEAGETAAAETPAAPGEVGFGHIKDAWPATLRAVNKHSRRVGAYLNPSRPVSFEGDNLVVEVQSEFHASQMATEANRTIFLDGLHSALGIRPRVSFAAQGVETPPPQPESSGEAADEPAEAHDPIELVKQGFGAEIVEERGRP